jgi:hypothetical protein
MKRWLKVFSVVLVLSTTAALSSTPEQEKNKPVHSDVLTAETRALVEQLEVQLEAQRTQLKATEASLSCARRLLTELESGSVQRREAISALRAEEQELVDRIENMRNRVKNASDPSLRFLEKRLTGLRERIKEAQRPTSD